MKSRKRCSGLGTGVKENVRRAEGEAPLLERRKKPRYFRPLGAATLWLDKSTTRAVEIGIIALSVLPPLSSLLSPFIRASQARGPIDEGVISPSFLFIVIKCFSPTNLLFCILALILRIVRLHSSRLCVSFCKEFVHNTCLKISQRFSISPIETSVSLEIFRASFLLQKNFLQMKFASTVWPFARAQTGQGVTHRRAHRCVTFRTFGALSASGTWEVVGSARGPYTWAPRL